MFLSHTILPTKIFRSPALLFLKVCNTSFNCELQDQSENEFISLANSHKGYIHWEAERKPSPSGMSCSNCSFRVSVL